MARSIGIALAVLSLIGLAAPRSAIVAPAAPDPVAEIARGERALRVLLTERATEVRISARQAVSAYDSDRGPATPVARSAEVSVRRGADRERPLQIEWAGTSSRPASRAILSPDAGGAVRVVARASGKTVLDGAYPGRVIVLGGSGDRLVVVNEVSVDEYLLGVLPREIGAQSPLEALKAQAIASRSYAIGRVGGSSGKSWDLTSDTSSQVYGGLGQEGDTVRRAVGETHGLVLLAGGQVVRAVYHACCGGSTAEAADIWGGSLPGAVAVCDSATPLGGLSDEHRVRSLLLDASPKLYCSGTPMFRWRKRFTAKQIEAVLAKRQSGGVGRLLDVRVGSRAPSGHARSLLFVGSKRTVTVEGDPIRWALGGDGLPSTLFALDRAGSADAYTAYEFFGGGWGHGVGMCQSGAIGMARAGRDFREILSHYYGSASIADLAGVGEP